ncbi:30S ribosome-binding factor RbfA [Helicobacter muridarum]|uniref:30S ribosome-binding factor RbfA n=1 Tax=Helicobacter muridarum TaxID=216 RepID=A0A099TYW5_9HELI|nr:30S ribosome-binding factor RbfA [Helicobacter muridarum]TLE00854.1 30S ribosome-binding factor RbfA [Helicobacter muridarum]STQ86622.1 ribosome-binding factor A [Helicobacter muridarum]
MQSRVIQQKREAFLKEIINEVFSSLHNEELNTLEIVDVRCSRGKYSAKIFIEASRLSKTQKQNIQKEFKRAKPFIQSSILHASKWFNAPKLILCFDSALQRQNKLDMIFAQISSERDDKGIA